MKRILGLFLVGMLMISNVSYAWPGYSWGGRHHGYRYRDGGWWFDGALATGLIVGAAIESLPPHHTVVYVNNLPYYYDGTYYYQASDEGYVVVDPPRVYIVPVIPANWMLVPWRGATYYVEGDTWRQYDGTKFVVVPNPTK